MPNQPKTPLKSFRIPEDKYQEALAKARASGETLTAVVNRMLEEYLAKD